MEPLGSITVYFPFIDEETKNVLESIMEEAYNYYDFVKILTQRILETDLNCASKTHNLLAHTSFSCWSGFYIEARPYLLLQLFERV